MYRELLDLENFPYKAKLSKLEEDRPKAIRYLARAIAPLDLREKKGPVTDRAQCILESAKGTLDTGRKPGTNSQSKLCSPLGWFGMARSVQLLIVLGNCCVLYPPLTLQHP